jgi:hypothetical protein
MSLDIIGVGWACPLGLRSMTAFAAVRAGLRQIDMLDDSDRLISRLEFPDDDPRDPGRLRAARATFFAAYALTEILSNEDRRVAAAFIAAPEHGPTGALDVAAAWAKLVAEFDPMLLSATRWFPSGRAGVFEAIAAAHEWLEQRDDVVLVGGFDSMVDDETLARLDAEVDASALRRTEQAIAGEGAAFVLLTRTRPKTTPLARLTDFALAHEAEPFSSGGPCRAAGLTAAFATLRGRISARVDVIHMATPGRGWWAQELEYAYFRNPALMPEPMQVRNLHEHIGDLGAAAGSAALVHAIRCLTPLFPGRQPEHRSALVYGCSNGGVVGACRLVGVHSP